MVLLLASVAAGAVINTENLPQTLFELRTELSREYNSRNARGRMMERMDSLQHHKLVDAIKKCNELSLMLYSQNQEYTFDMTYALEEVTREYQDFQRSRMPFDEMQEHLDTEIDKFTRLLASLEQLPVHDSSPAEPSDSLDAIVMQYPFYLDENALEDRDSCIFYVKGILEMYQDTKQRIINDNKYYEEAAERLKESYDYAQERYSLLQKKMFTRNRNNFFQTLASFGISWRAAVQDASRKYSHYRFDFRFSLQLILNYIWLILALLLSIFARMRGDRLKRCIKVFMPTCLLGLTVIVLRIIFIPNSLLNIIFPPLILSFFLWQFFSFKAYSRSLMLTDRVTSIVGIAVTLTAIVMSWMGYVMLSVLVVIWWLFQLAVIESLTAFSALLERYSRSRLRKKINAYKSDNPFIGDKNVKGQYIRITWWYDLVQMVVIPVIAIVSVPACVLLALDVFDLTEIFRELAVTEFFDLKDTEGNAILNLSAYRIVVVLVLFFLFRYLAYLAKSFYRDIKLRTFIAEGNTKKELAAHVYDITYGSLRAGEDNLVIIDDSIVRGTTLKESILRILDRLHPKKIVLVSSCPQVRYPDYYGIDMASMEEFIAFRAAIALLHERGMEDVVDRVYRACLAQREVAPQERTNPVKGIYAPFSDSEISEKMVRMLKPEGMTTPVEIVFQTLDGLHKACPNSPGDWYFSGDYPTPGGCRQVCEAFIRYCEQSYSE